MTAKRILILAIYLMSVLPSFAGEKADAIYRKYKEVENCTHVSLSGPLMKLAMGSAARQLPKGTKVSCINVVCFEKEKFPDTELIWTTLGKDLADSMDMLSDTLHEGNRVKIFVETDRDTVTSFVMFVLDHSQNVFAVLCDVAASKEEVLKMIEGNPNKK